MSRASELEEKRLTAERVATRCDTFGSAIAGDATVALETIAALLLTEASVISAERRKGWQSSMREYTAAGRILEQWAKDLAAYLERDKPPMRPPLETIPPPARHAGLDPADGPFSAQITSGLLAPVNHASPAWAEGYADGAGGLKPERKDDPNYADGFQTGDAERRINDGPAPDWPDGAITPDAATKVRLAIEAGHKPADDATLSAAFDPPQPAPGLEPMEDNVVRHPDGRFAGVASFAVQPDTLTGIQIHLHGQYFMAKPPERLPGQSGILVVNYTIRDGGATGITSISFTPDPPMIFADESVALSAQPVAAIPAFSEPGPAPARQLQQRMTFEAVRQHGMARARGEDHRSYSQVTAFAECGVRYALSDLDAAPAWWNVGGTALHYAVEAINLQRAPVDTCDWSEAFGRAISEAVKESGVTPDRWRAAKKGHEGYDWWRVEGPVMVGRWVNRLRALHDDGWAIATIDSKPAVELSAPMTIDVSTPIPWGGEPDDKSRIKVENILDLVMWRDDTSLIIDFKSGASAPDSTYQLGQYAHALAGVLPAWMTDKLGSRPVRIVGAYWLARSDMLAPVDVSKSDTVTDLRELHPWSEIEYLITTMHAAESQGLYLPNKSKSDRFGCGSCGVAGLCPVGPR